jgi:BirA family transcriptional regulator, biotin operon repressor / biotin---[acetyl-CoA-carboxylase] ligase
MPITAEPLPAELSEALSRIDLRRLGNPILFFSTVGSTNDVATALANSGNHEGAVVIAEAQTAGRGRRGRVWFSPPGAGLYVSVLLAPGRTLREPDRATALLPLTAGVALAEAVERVTGLTPAIKWPNDLLVGKRKLAGILAEGLAGPASHPGLQSVVLGYGLNVSASAFPLELSDRVTSLESELGRRVDRSELCAQSLAALAARYEDLLAAKYDAILDAWRARSPASRGLRVFWETPAGRQSGTTIGVDEMGALLVRVGERIERLVAGEVNWA